MQNKTVQPNLKRHRATNRTAILEDLHATAGAHIARHRHEAEGNSGKQTETAQYGLQTA